MIDFHPYGKFKELLFGVFYLELGVIASNDEDPAVELTHVYERRICRSYSAAMERYVTFVEYFHESEVDEHLGV